MQAQVLTSIGPVEREGGPLTAGELPIPVPEPHEVLIRVHACGVCHTELDEIEGRTPPPRLPVVPGHQVVGTVVSCGTDVTTFRPGDRVGVAWIFDSCGVCAFCTSGRENLCGEFRATGRDVNGGYAEFMTAPESSAFRLPPDFSDTKAAPLLCAGAIGYRSLRLAQMENGATLGLTGFGASAHLVLQMARHRHPGSKVFVFARSEAERAFARGLGATWAGDTADTPPEPCDVVIDTTPAWRPIVEALRILQRGGRLVVNAIRKEDADREALLQIRYPDHLWLEKQIVTVANVTRADVREFLTEAAMIPLDVVTLQYPLAEANRALLELKQQTIRGAKVLVL